MTDAVPPPPPDAVPPPPPEAMPPPPTDVMPPGRPPRAGQLTVAWQIMAGVGWAAAFFAFAGVWKASEEIGIATWWLGPRADPQPLVVRIVPFLIAVAVALWAVYNRPGFPWVSLTGTAGYALIAAFDLSRSTGLAVAEFAITVGVLLVSIATLGGRYRRPAAG